KWPGDRGVGGRALSRNRSPRPITSRSTLRGAGWRIIIGSWFEAHLPQCSSFQFIFDQAPRERGAEDRAHFAAAGCQPGTRADLLEHGSAGRVGTPAPVTPNRRVGQAESRGVGQRQLVVIVAEIALGRAIAEVRAAGVADKRDGLPAARERANTARPLAGKGEGRAGLAVNLQRRQ